MPEKHTPETVMYHLKKCETEVGIQIETLREELNDHQDIVKKMHDDWEDFLADFQELLSIFRSAKGFFTVLGWVAKGIRWLALAAVAVGAVIALIKGFGK